MADPEPEKKPYPFETRRGAFHPYTYVPFLGWLPPTELNILIVFFAILLAIVVPFVQKRRHLSRDLENLKTLRTALAEFEARSGRSPKDLDELVAAAGLKKLPTIYLTPNHSNIDYAMAGSEADDFGDWRYAPPGPGREAAVFINCTHTDFRGRVWSQY